MTIGKVTRTTAVIINKQTTVFQQWFTFENAQSHILIEVWDEDGGLNGKYDLMGKKFYCGTCVCKITHFNCYGKQIK